MKRSLLIICLLVLLPILSFCKSDRDKHTALFGKHTKKVKREGPAITCIFLDKAGNYYPDMFISDRQLKKCNSSLSDWYQQHTDKFNIICNKYGVGGGPFSKRLDDLNEAIALDVAADINKKSSNGAWVNISIHGFSKKAYGSLGVVDRHSTRDNKKLEQALMKDGSYIPIGTAPIHTKGYKLFTRTSSPNALKVGLSLRRVVTKILSPDINIITHSLGARVGCEILFNADTENLTAQAAMPTPAQPHVKLCMIAPAIDAELFANYFERGGITAQATNDNYSLSVVYNVYDFVLNKTLPLVLFHIGNQNAADMQPTTLGCDYHQDICKLRDKVAPETVRIFDLSRKHYKPRSCHYVNHCYINNTDSFSHIVNYLFQ